MHSYLKDAQLIFKGAQKPPKAKTPKRKKSTEGGGIVKMEPISGDQTAISTIENDEKNKKVVDGATSDQGGTTIVEGCTETGGDKEPEEKGMVIFF